MPSPPAAPCPLCLNPCLPFRPLCSFSSSGFDTPPAECKVGTQAAGSILLEYADRLLLRVPMMSVTCPSTPLSFCALRGSWTAVAAASLTLCSFEMIGGGLVSSSLSARLFEMSQRIFRVRLRTRGPPSSGSRVRSSIRVLEIGGTQGLKVPVVSVAGPRLAGGCSPKHRLSDFCWD